MKPILTFIFTMVLMVPSFAIHRHQATTNLNTELSNDQTITVQEIELTEVQGKPLSKQAIKSQKRFKRASKWIARYAEASGENRVLAAALLAFFIGALGIHRIYLGGSGLLVLGYIFTFGGLFGILPIIDFIRIVSGGIDHYEGNDALFAAFQNFGS